MQPSKYCNIIDSSNLFYRLEFLRKTKYEYFFKLEWILFKLDTWFKLKTQKERFWSLNYLLLRYSSENTVILSTFRIYFIAWNFWEKFNMNSYKYERKKNVKMKHLFDEVQLWKWIRNWLQDMTQISKPDSSQIQLKLHLSLI